MLEFSSVFSLPIAEKRPLPLPLLYYSGAAAARRAAGGIAFTQMGAYPISKSWRCLWAQAVGIF